MKNDQFILVNTKVANSTSSGQFFFSYRWWRECSSVVDILGGFFRCVIGASSGGVLLLPKSSPREIL